MSLFAEEIRRKNKTCLTTCNATCVETYRPLLSSHTSSILREVQHQSLTSVGYSDAESREELLNVV